MMKLTALLFVLLCAVQSLAREVEFSWDPMEGAVKYEIQIADNDNFDRPIVTQQLDAPNFSAHVSVGQYYYRVRVLDRKGHFGRWSKPSPLTVSPYAPELVNPQPAFETSYFEVTPPLEFTWKAVEGEPEYQIMIYKTTGQTIVETTVPGTEFKTNNLGEGDYQWKVRSVVRKTLFSSYSEPRKFTVIRKPITPPILIKPEIDGMSAAYREVAFEWQQDPATKYTDLYFEKLTGRDSEEPFKKKFENLSGSSLTLPYAEPGTYRWSVITKEAQTTPGVASEIHDFEVRDDILSDGNYELEFSASPVSDLYTTASARQNSGGNPLSQSTSSTGLFYGFSGGYYPLYSVGLFMSTRTASMMIENMEALQQETDFTLRLRFGSKGFNQEFWFGYRLMDITEAENTPATKVTDFTTAGGLFGTRMTATVVDGWRAQIQAFYYKPLSTIEGVSGLVADVYSFALGVKWNFMYQFWLGYRFQHTRITGTFSTPNMSPAVNATWTMYRTEPIFLSISFEH